MSEPAAELAAEVAPPAAEPAPAAEPSEPASQPEPASRDEPAPAPEAAAPAPEEKKPTIAEPAQNIAAQLQKLAALEGADDSSSLAAIKNYLMTASDRTDSNLYDHLTNVLARIIELRPSNPVDIFETTSVELKRSRFSIQNTDSSIKLQKAREDPLAAETLKKLAKYYDPNSDDKPSQEATGELPDIMELANIWEWAGISFGKEETFLLFLSLRKLVETKGLKSVRFWGKIQGTKKDYIIAEAEVKEGSEDAADAEQPAAPAEEESEEKKLEKLKQDPFANDAAAPKPKVKPAPVYHKEDKTGTNKYVYYVCHFIGDAWARLPDAQPETIQKARKIHKYFTGDLSHKIVSYPPFDNTEAHYLRAQIARISAATVVSPLGYYMFDPDEQTEDETQQPASIIINPEFEGLPNDQLLNLSNWVHHVPYILPQGRTTWENPYAKAGQDGEDGEGSEAGSDQDASDENNPGSEGAEPESGPAILSPANGDEENGDIPAWTPRICSNLSPIKFSPVFLRSTRWPGAHTVAYNDKFVNIYVGFGIKDIPKDPHFYPPALAAVQAEFTTEEPEALAEQADPTVADEKAYEEALKEKEEEQQSAEEDEGEEGENE